MKPEEIRMLLGGYATGSLTEEERKALFSAALENQEIFDALADEEALRELLADPRYRRDLAAGLADQTRPLGEKVAAWWRRPLPLVLTGGVAAVALAFVILYQREGPPPAVEVVAMRQSAPEPEGMQEERAEAPAAKLESRTAPETPKEQEPAEASGLAAPPAEILAPPPMIDGIPEPPALAHRDVNVQVDKPEREMATRDAEADLAQPEPSRMKMAGAEPRTQAEPMRSPQTGAFGAVPGAPAFSRPAARGRGAGEALPYSVEIRSRDGSFVALDPEDPVGLADAVRLRLRSPRDGQLYVAEQTPAGPWRLIYSGPAVRGQWSVVPLPPPAKGGERRLKALFSTQPLSLSQAGANGQLDESAAQVSADIAIRYR